MGISGIQNENAYGIKSFKQNAAQGDIGKFQQLMEQTKRADSTAFSSKINQRQNNEMHELTEQEINYLSQKYDVSDMSYDDQQKFLYELFSLGAISKEDYTQAEAIPVPEDGWVEVDAHTKMFILTPTYSPPYEYGRNFLANMQHIDYEQTEMAKCLKEAGYEYDYIQVVADRHGRIADVVSKLKK